MSDRVRWYDGVWLDAYTAAQEVIAEVAPSRLESFVRSFDLLRTDPGFSTRLIPDLIDATALSELQRIVKALPIEKLELHEVKLFGRFVVHDIPEFTAIQAGLIDRASQWAGEELEASYNFLGLYTQFGECRPHLDSPYAKWTLDLCVDQSDPWPIYISQVVPWPEVLQTRGYGSPNDIKHDSELAFSSLTMSPGDAIFFSGSSQWHYRDALPRDGAKRHSDLLFMHFFPKSAREIVRPGNWADYFDIPELARIEGIKHAL